MLELSFPLHHLADPLPDTCQSNIAYNVSVEILWDLTHLFQWGTQQSSWLCRILFGFTRNDFSGRVDCSHTMHPRFNPLRAFPGGYHELR